MNQTFSPHQKMLLGVAIGDAFGAGYEFRFKDLKSYQDVKLEKYIKSAFTDSDHFPGMYTDDTQMSIAVAELLASNQVFSRENLADKFVECYKRDPIKRYAKGFQKFLDSVDSGEEFMANIHADSERNGAAMRAVPIGLVQDLDELIEYAKINASLTHNNPRGIASSVAIALMSHFAFYSNPLHQDKEFVKLIIVPKVKKIDYVTSDYMNLVLSMEKFDPILLFGAEHVAKGVPCDGMRTVGAVTYLLTNLVNPKKILQTSIKLGGDVDSVASISLGIGLTHSDVGCLPRFLYDDLTNHEYGRDYILSLGRLLERQFPF